MMIHAEEPATHFRVALDDLTVERLMELAADCNADPRQLMAAIIKDVLAARARGYLLELISVH